MFKHEIDGDTYLKLLDVEDAPALFALTDHSRAHLRTWLPWVDHTTNVADSRVFIEGTKKQFADNNGFQAGIWYQGQLAGVAGFHKIDWGNQKTEIGYWLGASLQGRGLMTQTCRALIAHAFAEWGLHRIEIHCGVGNTKSAAIPKRLGFTREGCIRDAERLADGHFNGLEVFGMLSEEWQGLMES